MTGGAALGGSVPRRLVGGGWRRKAERARLWWAARFVVRDLLAVVLALAAGTAAAGRLGAFAAVVVVVAVVVVERHRITWHVAGLWWRIEWRWAMRAAGLARLAELDIDETHTPAEATVEVVPVLVRVERTADGRRYVCRPLPGQRVEDFEKACDVLMIRWRCESVEVVRVLDQTRRGHGRVVLTVSHGHALRESPEFIAARPARGAHRWSLPGLVRLFAAGLVDTPPSPLLGAQPRVASPRRRLIPRPVVEVQAWVEGDVHHSTTVTRWTR